MWKKCLIDQKIEELLKKITSCLNKQIQLFYWENWMEKILEKAMLRSWSQSIYSKKDKILNGSNVFASIPQTLVYISANEEIILKSFNYQLFF